MRYPNFFHYFIFTLFSSAFVFSQINTEAMRNSQDEYGFTNAFGFDLGFEKSNEEVVEIAGKYRLDYVTRDGLHSFLVLNYENGYEKENDITNSIVNKGFRHLRFTKNLFNNIFVEFFVQYGFNDFLLMKERLLYGSGFRYRFFDSEKMNTHIGIGLMQEDEIYDESNNDWRFRKNERVGNTLQRSNKKRCFKGSNKSHYSCNWNLLWCSSSIRML